MTDPLNIIFDNIGTCLLGFRIKFSSHYILQEHVLKFVAMSI